MERIRPTKLPYRIREDVREEPIRLGKYIYITALIVVVAAILYVLFGHLFILKGEGFVFSKNNIVALEFDATISHLYVEEGDRVDDSALLFKYDSISLKKALLDYASRLNDLYQTVDEARLRLVRAENGIDAAQKYADFAAQLSEKLTQLKNKKYIEETRISPEVERNFEAAESLATYQAQRGEIQLALATLEKNINRLEGHYLDLVRYYNNGEFYARNGGVVTGLNITEGSVLQNTDPAMRIFYGKRFIFCYFEERSWVKYKVGDRVIVNAPGKPYKIGKIVELMPVSNRVPEEFQPRFKQIIRNQVAIIETEQDLLSETPIMSTVSIRKPMGMHLLF